MSIPRGVAGALALLLLAPVPAVSQQPPTLTLDEAVAAALARHPRVEAAAFRVEAAGHRAEQAGRWPNPELTAYRESFPGAVPDADQWIVSLSQRLPIGGQPGTAREAARAGEEATRWEARAERANLALRVQREYARLEADQARGRRLRQALDSTRSLLRDLEARLLEGDVSEFDVRRLRLEVRALEVRTAESASDVRQSTIRLASLTGLEPPSEGWRLLDPGTQPGGPPPVTVAGPGFEVGADVSETGRPEVLAARERRLQAGLHEKLARREPIPDLVVDVGYSRIDPARDGFVWSISAVLPLFDRNRDAVAAAASEERARERHVAALEREARAQRRQARQEYEAVTRMLAEVEEPAEDGLLSIAVLAYEEGEAEVVTVLDTVRAALDVGLRRIELRRRRSEAWFRWKWAAGRALEESGR